MSAGEMRTMWTRYYESVNQRDIDLIDRLTDEYYTSDAIFHNPTSPVSGSGSAAQKAGARQMLANTPDLHIVLDDVLVDGDKTILRGTIQLNDPSTGAKTSAVFLDIARLVDGKAAELWSLMVPRVW